MKIFRQKIKVQSKSQIEFLDITDQVEKIVGDSGVREGQVLVYIPHTSAGVIINHNEAMLLQDFMRVFYRLVPVSDRYSHDLFELNRSRNSDGRSNGHSHCKAILIGTSATIPIEGGKMLLTERQNIFLAEMDGARSREIVIQVLGE